VLAQRPDDPLVLKPAADFVRFEDLVLYRELLNRGRRLAPDDPHWRDHIRNERRLRAEYAETDEERIACGLEAQEDYNAELANEKRRTYRFWLGIKLAEAALWAANLPLAAQYAEGLVTNADKVAGTWVHGDVVHWGHIFLGRIALANDALPRALEHLAAAGATPGSRELTARGPDQKLALELIKRGEDEAVIAYVEACKLFWGGGMPMLGGAYRNRARALNPA